MRLRRDRMCALGHTANRRRQSRNSPRQGAPGPHEAPPCLGPPMPPKVPKEQVGVGLEVLNGRRVHEAETEDGWGWGPAEHAHDASREGHGQLPSYSSQAAGEGVRRLRVGSGLCLAPHPLLSPGFVAAGGSPHSSEEARP